MCVSHSNKMKILNYFLKSLQSRNFKHRNYSQNTESPRVTTIQVHFNNLFNNPLDFLYVLNKLIMQ